MDYSAEIAANNARINELKAELAQLKAQPVLGTNAMDYQLAAQRAKYGDMSGAQYHLNKPEERDRLAKMMNMNSSSLNSDIEYQYATLQDKVAQAEETLAYTPKSNTAAVQQAKRNLRQAQINQKMFERKHPSLVKMHWNWRNEAEKELDAQQPEVLPQVSENTIEGLKALMAQNSYTDPGSGNVYWNNEANPFEIYNYGKNITGAMENQEVRDLLNTIKLRQTMAQSVNTPTMSNLKVFLTDPTKTSKSGRLIDEKQKAEAQALWNSMSDAEKRTEDGQKLKRLIDGKTQARVNREIKEMREEGEALLRRVQPKSQAEADLIRMGALDNFTDEWGRKWTRDKSGYWSTPNWTKKLK